MWRWVMSNGFGMSNGTTVELGKEVAPEARTVATTTHEAGP